MKKKYLLFISLLLIALPLAAKTISYLAPDLPPNSYWEQLADPGKDKQYFQFYIVSDRTGGMQPGVFEDALEKLNFLQPELVMSVGDLVVGYTKEEEKIDAQWQDVDKLIEKLDAPFLPVNGNH
ncbi:hypothetical protein KAH55_02125, partial [bacterium]|nr:hypothetical protein [bacterium]